MTKPKLQSQLKGKASTLSVEDVQRIRQVAADRSQTPREIASFYGVGTETIRRIIRRETWNDIPESTFVSEEELQQAAAQSMEKLQQMLAAAKAQKEAGPAFIKEMALDETSVEAKARSFGVVATKTVIQPVVEEGEHDAGYD